VKGLIECCATLIHIIAQESEQGCIMSTRIAIDSDILTGANGVERVDVDLKRHLHLQNECSFSFTVLRGRGGWPTPYEIGIYIDTDGQMCLIDWQRPCNPIKFTPIVFLFTGEVNYGEFVFHLDTATEDEIASAIEVNADFFRSD